ncbi:MAG: AAA family ATPase [Vulcanibacillus sp.]
MKYSFEDMISLFPDEIVDKLKKTIQDPKWHSEGPVYEHIKLVFNYIQNKYADDLDLLICALFHDLGKINTTKVYEKKEGIRIHAIGHETFAEMYIDTLKECFLHFEGYNKINWEKVKHVCANHMRYHMYVTKQISKPSKRENMEKHIYFSDGLKFEDADSNSSIQGMQNAPYLIILMGIPGSGKTTWRKKFLENQANQDWSVICPDGIRQQVTGKISDGSQDNVVWNIVYAKLSSELIYTYNDIIFDATNCNTKTQKAIEKIAKENNAIIMYKIFECDRELAKERIKIDIENNINRSNVPSEVVDRMANNFMLAKKRVEEKAREKDVWIIYEDRRK